MQVLNNEIFAMISRHLEEGEGENSKENVRCFLPPLHRSLLGEVAAGQEGNEGVLAFEKMQALQKQQRPVAPPKPSRASFGPPPDMDETLSTLEFGGGGDEAEYSSLREVVVEQRMDRKASSTAGEDFWEADDPFKFLEKEWESEGVSEATGGEQSSSVSVLYQNEQVVDDNSSVSSVVCGERNVALYYAQFMNQKKS